MFFDDFNERTSNIPSDSCAASRSLLPAYIPIVERRKNQPSGSRDVIFNFTAAGATSSSTSC